MEFFIQILIAAVAMGTPLLFATLGGVISERAGVINLGMEGLMLVGALVAFVVMLNTGNYFYAVAAAAFCFWNCVNDSRDSLFNITGKSDCFRAGTDFFWYWTKWFVW
jgi:nucleoside ABC transporter membrane protein